MFNLDEAISEWRRQMATHGISSSSVLDELESHLREDVDRMVRSGLREEEVFATAVRQIGRADVLKNEFTKSHDTVAEKLKRFILILVGIPNPQFATTMNTPHSVSNLELRWATYLKAAAFSMPAAFLWAVSVVFLLPKLQLMCRQAGTSLFTLHHAPAMFRASAFVGQGMIFLTHHGLLVTSAILLIFLLLEWRSSEWPRYRRAAVGIGTFLLNLVVLISITLMVVAAIVTAANFHHAK